MSLPETTSLLLEIGCEEIPARFLTGVERGLGEQLRLYLLENRLLVVPDGCSIYARDEANLSPLQTFATSRRLIAYMPVVLRRQFDHVHRVEGPPVKVGIGPDGKYTRAAEAFAARNNTTTADLKLVTTAKGEYLQLEQRESGEPALKVLVEVLEVLLWNIYSFVSKSMYWTVKSGPRFVRPIRWILALLGEGRDAQVVSFEFAQVKSGQHTFGHRLTGNKSIYVTGFSDYMKKLREHMVEPEPERRRQRTQQGIRALLEESRSRIVADEWLETWVVNSTEWPVPLLGGFDKRYLALPREVLVTVMRDHQKYFAVEDEAGNLCPYFITVLNVDGDPEGLIRQGHERVLTARFTDAEFFWNSDQRVPLRERIVWLEKVTYAEKLGSYGDKVRRMRGIAAAILNLLESQDKIRASEKAFAFRAVELCKCDLTTQMVQEFTELQGVIGGLYAKAQGEPEEVAEAIYDHYLPSSMEDRCPKTVTGCVVSLADKIDSIIAGFSAGLEPTGSADPFGLRRAGNGIIKVSVEMLPEINLQRLLGDVLRSSAHAPDRDRAEEKLTVFFRERLEHYLASVAQARYDTIRAVVKSYWSWAVPSAAVERARALEMARDSEDFASLAAAAKRTRNILEKSARLEDFIPSPVIEESLLTSGSERELYEAYAGMKARLEEYESRHDFAGAFRALAGLREPVDRFFDQVLVMDPDAAVRRNRLALLRQLNELVFLRLADLGEISAPGEIVGASTTMPSPVPHKNS